VIKAFVMVISLLVAGSKAAEALPEHPSGKRCLHPAIEPYPALALSTRKRWVQTEHTGQDADLKE